MRHFKIDFSSGTQPLATVIARRRATPAFRSDPVPEELLDEALELGTLAPSGYNLQPWRFIVVRDIHERRKLRAAAYDRPLIEQAPVMIIACGDTAAWRESDLELTLKDGLMSGSIPNEEAAARLRRDAVAYLSAADLDLWVTRQTMLAFSFLMLAAESLGLDTAPIEEFEEDKVRAAFGIPKSARVVALLGLGYLQPPDKPFGGRFDLEKVVCEGRYGAPFTAASGRLLGTR